MSVRYAATARSRPTSSSSSSSSSSVPVPADPKASSSRHHPLFPVLLKHPRCRPFFRLGNYGVVAARVELTPGSPTFNAMHRVFDRDDVELLGSEAKRVHQRAKENLRALFESGAMMIRTGRTPAGRGGGHAYLAIEHPTLASSCLFLPGLTQSASAFLGGRRFACVVLRRDLIAVFEDQGSPRACAEVARAIAHALVQNGATFDLDLFSLDEIHPQPMLTTPSAPPPPAPPTPVRSSRPKSASGMYPRVHDPRKTDVTLEERGLQRPKIRLRSDPPPPPPSPPLHAYAGHTQVIELPASMSMSMSMDPPTVSFQRAVSFSRAGTAESFEDSLPRPPRAIKATVSF